MMVRVMEKHVIGIVGGCGYLGSALARHLCGSFKVKVLDVVPMSKDLKDMVEFRKCDVRRYDEVSKEVDDVNLVVHTSIIQLPAINREKKLGYEVNVLGTQNVCDVVDKTSSIKGMILAGSWHVFGERGLRGFIDEKFGFRPDEVTDPARFYAFSKITQEMMCRIYDSMSEKVYGVIRLGTMLGEGMPEKTAANIFITRGLKGEPITPFKHSMHRPMLYVDINDACRAFEAYIKKMLNNEIKKTSQSPNVVNVCWPKPITVLEFAHVVKEAIEKQSRGTIKPEVEVVDTGEPDLFEPSEGKSFEVDLSALKKLVDIKSLTSPRESVERIVKQRIVSGG